MSYHIKQTKSEQITNAVFFWAFPVFIVALIIGTAIKLLAL